jgi:hypothetical protein
MDVAPEYNVEAVADAWPVLHEAALHGLAGEFVAAVLPGSEADPAGLLGHFLLFFGNVIGRNAHAYAGDVEHYANMFVVFVGATSSGRKGTAAHGARRIFRAAEPEWEKSRVMGGLSTGEGLIHAVRDDLVKVTTRNGKEHREEIQGVEDKRLCLIESEFARVLRVMGREQSTLGAILRQAYDGPEVLATLVKKDASKATGAHISIAGHITVDELRKELDSIEAANGFGNRFLWICVRRSKYLPEGGAHPDMSRLANRLEAAIDHARGRGLGLVDRDDAAKALWAEHYKAHLSDCGPGLWGQISGRGAPAVLRLSLIYALLDGARRISPPHLKAALALWDYNVASVKLIFGDSTGDQEADRLLDALRRQPDGLTREQISADVFSRHLSAVRLDIVLNLLQRLDRVAASPVATGGRTATVWRLK